jgi:DNA ligase-1
MRLSTLYKRSVTGKVSTWYVEVKDECFRTVSGFLDGEKVTSAWTCCNAKSYNTAEQQADAEAQAMFTKRKALGYWEDRDDIDTPIYFKPMLAQDYNDHKNKIKYPILSQPKLDGIRCIVRSDGMWSRNGKEIISAPHIFNDLRPLFEENPDLILDGELFAERSVIDFNTIISCVRKTKPTALDLVVSKKYIQYWIYDVPSVDDVFSQREAVLYMGLALPDSCVKVLSTVVHNEEELMSQYKEYMVQGYEGQILRVDAKYENKRSRSLLKHKSFFDEEFEILGYEEGKGNLSNKLGKLKFKTKNGVEFDAAVNGTWDYLTELWSQRNDLIGKQATVKYFEYTEDGSLRFPKVINIGREDYE